jgi:hypothetical protein
MVYLRYCPSILPGKTVKNYKITVTIAGIWAEKRTWAHVNVNRINN